MNQKHPLRTPLALACALLASSAALAAAQAPTTLPTGAQVTAGSASLQQSGNALTIKQNSDRAIIDWRSFSIGSQAGVTFEQPSSSSVVLNRVLGSAPSQIDGSLRANGQVFLVNPGGVIFGQGARVDAQGLVASTLAIADDDFLAGRYRFTRSGSTAAVVNEGDLHARYVALLAPEVRNEGAIVAERGTIAMAGGEAVTLKLSGQDLVDIVVDPASIATLVENRRLVQAADGKVLIAANSANSLLGSVINTGRIEANGISADGGLVRIDASSRIELGGSVSADAGTQGKGGRIEVIADLARADSQTLVSAKLSARGGTAGGDGGFIETSGSHLNIASEARVDTSAAHGRFGQWLLDPTDFRIAASGGDMTGSALSTALQTSSVTIETRSTGSGLGDILVDDAISWSNNPGTTLTLKAHRNIEINARITVGSVGYATITEPGTSYDFSCHCYPDVETAIATGERLHLLPGQSGRGGFRIGSAGSVDSFYSGSGGYGKVMLGATASEVTVSAPLRAGYRGAGHILTAYVRPGSSTASSVYGDVPATQYALFDTASGGTALNVAANGTAGWSTTLTSQSNAGTYTLSYTGGLSLSEYDILAGSAVTWTVKPRPLNLSATKIYDGVPYFVAAGLVTGASYTLTGMVNGDAMPAPVGGFFTGSSPNAGSYTSLAAGSAPALVNANYTLAGGSTQLTIQPRQTSITVSKVYDGSAVFDTGFALSNPAPWADAPTFSGSLQGGTANVSTQGFLLGVLPRDSLSLVDPHGNYQVSQLVTGAITPKPLAVSVAKTYDGSTQFTGGFTFTGMVGSEAAPTVNGTARTASANAGSYTGFVGISPALSDANYSIGTVAALISPKELSISATRAYDGTATLQSGFQLQGMVTGQAAPTVGGSTSIAAAGVASTAYSFLTSGLNLDNANYILPGSGLATITPKALDISVSRTYDGSAGFSTGFKLTGMVGSELAPTVSGTASVSSANASSTAFTAFSSSTLALSDGNYTLTGGQISASITPRPLTLTVSKTYDGSGTFVTGTTAFPSASSFALSGMVGTEAAPTISGAANTASANAGNYASFSSSGLTLSDTNYMVGTVAALISPKVLSISATRHYDGTTTLLPAAFKLEGLAANETAPTISGSAGITAAGAASTAYTFGTSALSLNTGNYTLPVTGLATITPKPLNIVVSKAYDGNASFVTGTDTAPSASSFALSGMVGTETAPPITGSASVSSANASSTAFSAFLAGSTLALSNAANYTLTGGTVSASIKPRPLNVTVAKNYDGSPAFTTGFKLTGMVGSEAAPSITTGSASVASASANSTAYTSFSTNTLTLSNPNYTTLGGAVSASILGPGPNRTNDVGFVFNYMIQNIGTLAGVVYTATFGDTSGASATQSAGLAWAFYAMYGTPASAYGSYKAYSNDLESSLTAQDAYTRSLNAAMNAFCPLCTPFTTSDIRVWFDAKLLGS